MLFFVNTLFCLLHRRAVLRVAVPSRVRWADESGLPAARGWREIRDVDHRLFADDCCLHSEYAYWCVWGFWSGKLELQLDIILLRGRRVKFHSYWLDWVLDAHWFFHWIKRSEPLGHEKWGSWRNFLPKHYACRCIRWLSRQQSKFHTECKTILVWKRTRSDGSL